MLRALTGMFMGVILAATPVFAQSTTSTTLSGKAFGFRVMDSTMPDPFSFTAQSGVEPNGIDVPSNIITISGITEPVTASVSDLGTGGAPKISVNGAPSTTSPVQVEEGDQVLVSIRPDTGVFSATYQAQVTIGGGSAIFQVTTRGADTAPDNLVNFVSASNQEPGVLVESADQTITGLEAPAAVSVSAAAGAPQVSFDEGETWGVSGSVANNGTVRVRLTSGTFRETRVATVTIGGQDATFAVTTRSSNNNPVFADFTDETSAEPGVTVESDLVTVTGIETTVTASVSGEGLPQIRVNDGTWESAGTSVTVTNNDTVRVRLTSGTFGETLTAVLDVNGVTQDFDVTTRAANTTPDAFTIAAVTDAPASSLAQSSATISGIEAAAVVTISGEGSPAFSTDGGSNWTDVSGSGFVENEGTILVRLTSGTFDATRTATLTVGEVEATFSVTTEAQDTTPDAFSFASALAAGGTISTSDPVTLSGFTGSVPISVSGDASAEYRIGTGAWADAPGTVSAGQEVRVRLEASAIEGATRTATLTVGSGSGSFTVETQDRTPSAFTIASVTDAELNAVTGSEPVTISGITGSVPISVEDAFDAEYRINAGGWTALPGSVEAGDTVAVRLLSANAYTFERVVILTVGTVTEPFSVTTGEPVSITITSGSVPDGEEGQAYAGFDFTTVASVSGGSPSSPPTVNDLGWSVTAGALPAGMGLSAAGDLTGTPTEIGSFSFTVQAELNGQTASASYTIIVNDPDGSFVIEGG